MEADSPNRVTYPHDSEGPFKSTDDLSKYVRKVAETFENESLSKTSIRAKISRIMFRAIYIDPTLIRIEGMHLKKKDGEDLYQTRYSKRVESILIGISRMYGGCGIINALRLLILHIGLAFDERGLVFGVPLDELEITCDNLLEAAMAIELSNSAHNHPLEIYARRTQLRINDTRSLPICFMPKSLRLALLKDYFALQSSYGDEPALKEALVKTWLEERRYWIRFPEEHQIRAIENALRAICELDGQDPKTLGITSEATPPVVVERRGIMGHVTITPVEDESERHRITERQEEKQRKSGLIATIVISIIAGGIIGLALNIAVTFITKSDYLNYSRGATLLFVMAGAIIAPVITLALNSFYETHGFASKKQNENAVRSEWEETIANHVTTEFPSLKVETNNRSIIKSRSNASEYYEIDIWIPEIKLGIEANGERYHDRATYLRDAQFGTAKSEEMHKEKYCENKGLKLIHVGDSDDLDEIFATIDKEIRERMKC